MIRLPVTVTDAKADSESLFNPQLRQVIVGSSSGHFIHKGKGRKDIFDLIGKVKFADGYDHKALREGE